MLSATLNNTQTDRSMADTYSVQVESGQWLHLNSVRSNPRPPAQKEIQQVGLVLGLHSFLHNDADLTIINAEKLSVKLSLNQIAFFVPLSFLISMTRRLSSL